VLQRGKSEIAFFDWLQLLDYGITFQIVIGYIQVVSGECSIYPGKKCYYDRYNTDKCVYPVLSVTCLGLADLTSPACGSCSDICSDIYSDF
jgi:hypothetical protein